MDIEQAYIFPSAINFLIHFRFMKEYKHYEPDYNCDGDLMVTLNNNNNVAQTV
jgi:hypothetical protein